MLGVFMMSIGVSGRRRMFVVRDVAACRHRCYHHRRHHGIIVVKINVGMLRMVIWHRHVFNALGGVTWQRSKRRALLLKITCLKRRHRNNRGDNE